jgi:ABC-2 type transport system ATP-binding protein
MESVIEISGLCKKFEGRNKPALDAISLAIPKNSIYGLIGADGAGKSTLLKILVTLERADSGMVKVLGRVLPKEANSVRTSIGYMPQRFSLYPDLTVQENLDFFADIFGVRNPERRQVMEKLLAFSRLERFTKRRAGNLSGGMKQKLALCCALIHAPRLLVLDEPTTGVDPVSRSEFWDILKGLAGQGVSLLVSTPYMDETRYCDEVGIVHEGKILCHGSPASLLTSFPHVIYRAASAQECSGKMNTSGAVMPQFIVRSYASGGDITVVVKKETDEKTVTEWIKSALGRSFTGSKTTPVMEDIFIEQLENA